MQDLLVGAMICAIALGIGFFAGSAYRGTQLRKAGEDLEELRIKLRDQSRWLQEYKDIHARDSEIATLIPSMVRRLAERHPIDALPLVAVRLTKELFRTVQVAFAIRKKDGSLLVTEGVGIPEAWKGTLTLSPGDGMIGDAMREKILVLREEHAARRGRPELSDLERAGETGSPLPGRSNSARNRHPSCPSIVACRIVPQPSDALAIGQTPVPKTDE